MSSYFVIEKTGSDPRLDQIIVYLNNQIIPNCFKCVENTVFYIEKSSLWFYLTTFNMNVSDYTRIVINSAEFRRKLQNYVGFHCKRHDADGYVEMWFVNSFGEISGSIKVIKN